MHDDGWRCLATEGEIHVRRRPTKWFTVDTSTGKGWYHSQSGAMSAARWIALETREHVAVSNEATGQAWDVSPATPSGT